jgi:RNA polymerase sigma-70 factor (ECF subfamily)
MIDDRANKAGELDESAVAAVRGGDVERYRELVERHERRVFAIAWSRLGDAAMAEEVTQEAFIRAYRHLWLLGNGAKFSGWVNTIARRIAINFGRRRRRELNKRERWALENAANSSAENSTDETNPSPSPAMLRQTLAELPDSHRECLVLFYFESKSGAEAAAALGISESALRVRLHRARAAMRERLEQKLERSLANLRPAKTLVPAVMAAVLVSSSAKAAAGGTAAMGTGAKLLSALGSKFLFSWMAPVFSLVTLLPSLGFTWFVARMERRNYRDADGFRPQLHRKFYQSFLWGFPLLIVLMAVMNQSTLAAWGIKGSQLFLGCFMLFVTLIGARFTFFFRTRRAVDSFVYCCIVTVGTIALAVGWLPSGLASLPILLATVWFFCTFKRPLRMDYSLFLRAAHGQLIISDKMDDPPPINHIDRHALKSFARFLGSRLLVNNFRWETNGLTLRLPPVANRFLTGLTGLFMPPVSRNGTHVCLGSDGTVLAHCGKTDLEDLTALKTGNLTDSLELESVVAETIGQAWREFRNGNLVAAERILGDSPESEVFIVPPSRAKSMRWWRIFLGAAVALMMIGMMFRFFPSAWMARLDGLKPVSLSEAQVREFLSRVGPNPNPLVKAGEGHFTKISFAGDPDMALFTCLALPGTNLFTPHALKGMRDAVAGSEGFDGVLRRDDANRTLWIFSGVQRRAMVAGWISWNDLGIRPEDAGAFLHTNRWFGTYSPEHWDYFLSREGAWSWVQQERWDVMRIQLDGVTQLQLLRDVNSLDLVDRDKLIQQIASVQTLSANPPGNPPIHDWKDVRGLFFTPCYPVLQDTYFSLAALQILGGLDKIDREACIKGILKRHAGRGCFTSPDSGGYNEYHIDGSARDTIAAFESLRILGALERVKDLDKWRFRVASRRASQPDAKGVRVLTWDEIEAWTCQQRLDEIVRDRKANPQAPMGSLLQPLER